MLRRLEGKQVLVLFLKRCHNFDENFFLLDRKFDYLLLRPLKASKILDSILFFCSKSIISSKYQSIGRSYISYQISKGFPVTRENG